MDIEDVMKLQRRIAELEVIVKNQNAQIEKLSSPVLQ